MLNEHQQETLWLLTKQADLESSFWLFEYLEIGINQYPLDIDGIHGFNHWCSVATNGLACAENTPADKWVILLFSFFHDCCREHDGREPYHGERAAQFIIDNREEFPQLSDIQINKLVMACEGHNLGEISKDITIGCCWDADRLDLIRIGIQPRARFMSSEVGKSKSLNK